MGSQPRRVIGQSVVEESLVDASYVTAPLRDDGEATLLNRCAVANGDLWKELVPARGRQKDSVITKVSSHMPCAEVLAGRLPLSHYVFNGVADAAAAAAANATQTPAAIVKEHRRWQTMVYLWAERIATIE